MPCLGAGRPASASTRPNAPRSSARWIASGRGADDRHAVVLERLREAERRLAAELHDDAGDRAGGALGVVDLEHVLEGERLEVQPVGGVVVGRHRLGVAVDHDGLEPGIRQGEGRHARTSSRTRCPGRCGWGRCRGSGPRQWCAARPRSPRRTPSSGTASSRRTRPRRCRRSCRPGGCRGRAGPRGRPPPASPAAGPAGRPRSRAAWPGAAARGSARAPRAPRRRSR